MLKFYVVLYASAFLMIAGSGNPISSTPPDPANVAAMARYIIHEVDWIGLATVSTLPKSKNYPFVNIKSMSDGTPDNGSGIPYLYITDNDLSALDLQDDVRVTVMASLAQTDYCNKQDYDQQDPRCARVIQTGKFVKISNTSDEYKFGKEALFSRHPAMKNWPPGHHFYVGKVNIEQVIVLDQLSKGIKFVPLEDYFKAKPNNKRNMERIHDELKKWQIFDYY